MFRPRIIPCLLIRNGGLLKTVKFNKSCYIGDPLNAVRLFNELEADELCFLDIDAAREGRTISEELVHRIGKEAYMPFSVGGGIKSPDEAKRLIAAGAEKVILNTFAIEDISLLDRIASDLGSQSVVASIDAKRNWFGAYQTAIFSGRKMIKSHPWEMAKRMEESGAGEIIINSIDQDGTMKGYDVQLIKKITDCVRVPVIALGGAGKYEDFKDAVNIGGASAVAAGSLFVFFGAQQAVLINYPDKNTKKKIFYENIN